MKLIIDIPDNEYEYTCERTLSDRTFWDDAIRKGVPLDDITTVIRNKYDSIPWRYNDNDDGWIEALEWSLEVVENILSKAESEENNESV